MNQLLFYLCILRESNDQRSLGSKALRLVIRDQRINRHAQIGRQLGLTPLNNHPYEFDFPPGHIIDLRAIPNSVLKIRPQSQQEIHMQVPVVEHLTMLDGPNAGGYSFKGTWMEGFFDL